MKTIISFITFVYGKSPPKNKEISMNDNEIGNPPIKALIVFKDNGDTDNLYVPILCDAIRTTGIDVRCSTNEFWDSDTPYDIIHFQWPEEVMGWNCDDPDRIRRLEERITFFRSRGARFVYTRHNVRPHDANEVIGRAYDIITKNIASPCPNEFFLILIALPFRCLQTLGRSHKVTCEKFIFHTSLLCKNSVKIIIIRV